MCRVCLLVQPKNISWKEMANRLTLHERIAAHPGWAHSEWAAQHPEATLQERARMLKRFERIGQKMLEDLNRHRRPEPRERYSIPGEPDYAPPPDRPEGVCVSALVAGY